MAVPDFQTLMLPVLRVAANGEIRVAEAIERLSTQFNLTADERSELLPSGRQAKMANRVHWAVTYLVKAGLAERPRRGFFGITDKGRTVLANPPARIDIAFLSQFEGFEEFRARATDDATTEVEPTVSLAAGTPEERVECRCDSYDIHRDLLPEPLYRLKGLGKPLRLIHGDHENGDGQHVQTLRISGEVISIRPMYWLPRQGLAAAKGIVDEGLCAQCDDGRRARRP